MTDCRHADIRGNFTCEARQLPPVMLDIMETSILVIKLFQLFTLVCIAAHHTMTDSQGWVDLLDLLILTHKQCLSNTSS